MKEEIKITQKAKDKGKDLVSTPQSILAKAIIMIMTIQIGIVKKEEKALIENDKINIMIKVRIIRIKNMIMIQKNMIIKVIIEKEKDHHQAVNPEEEIKQKVKIMKISKKLSQKYHRNSSRRKQNKRKN
jgi:hypothetical protein